MRIGIRLILRSLNYDVRMFDSADQFLSVPGQYEPDCLISDVNMPGTTGEELQALLTSAGRTLPIIFISAFPDSALRERLKTAGARDVLEKPASRQLIADSLSAILAKE